MRHELLADVNGDVLEIGPGTGHNAALFPDGLRSLTLAGPSATMRTHLAERYQDHATQPRIDPDAGERLNSVPDSAMDVVVATLVLCSVSDPNAVFASQARVASRWPTAAGRARSR